MEKILNTPCGMIKGIKENDSKVISYKGIRYATAKRFEYPTIVEKWDGIYDATNFGNCSYQPRAFYDEKEMVKKVFYYNEFRKDEQYTYSEDCLFLNIWTKDSEEKSDLLPVIIYIHGGGFTGGCGHEKHFKTPKWPLKDVIAVTINYRLGPLGFACIQDFKDDEGVVGNYGLYDQLTAIKWVKNNIESFGGNPNNITIMGQSAGAMSVQHLCLSSLTKGLFTKAVMSSGGGVSKLLATPKPEKRYKLWEKVKEISKVQTYEELKTIPVEQLFESFDKARKELKIMGMPASPVVDGKLITNNVELEYAINNISYMVGSNSEDIIPPIIFGMAHKWSSMQKNTCYCWMFDHQLPGDDNGAWHSSDLWYWFNTLENCWRPLTEDDYKLSDSMTTYLTNFAKSGNPNGEGLTTWEATNKKNKKVLHLNQNIKMKKVKKSKLWYNMFTNENVGE